jgi:nitric oxide reductase activation protein
MNITAASRIMLVVSDGFSNGVNYRGPAAVQATRKAVDEVRRSGIRVLNIAVADQTSESIFGLPFVLKFTESHRLVTDIHKLVTRLIRGASR